MWISSFYVHSSCIHDGMPLVFLKTARFCPYPIVLNMTVAILVLIMARKILPKIRVFPVRITGTPSPPGSIPLPVPEDVHLIEKKELMV